MTLLRKRGQSTGEYAVLFAVVLGAVIAMQNYIRNRIAGGIRDQADAYQTALGSGLHTPTTSSDQISTTLTNLQGNTGAVDTRSRSVSVAGN
jgi:hypothetical protein